MGAIIAAQYALGWDTQTMLQRNRDDLASKNLSREFTLPLVSLTSGRSFDDALNSFFGDIRIEDLNDAFDACRSAAGDPVLLDSAKSRLTDILEEIAAVHQGLTPKIADFQSQLDEWARGGNNPDTDLPF